MSVKVQNTEVEGKMPAQEPSVAEIIALRYQVPLWHTEFEQIGSLPFAQWDNAENSVRELLQMASAVTGFAAENITGTMNAQIIYAYATSSADDAVKDILYSKMFPLFAGVGTELSLEVIQHLDQLGGAFYEDGISLFAETMIQLYKIFEPIKEASSPIEAVGEIERWCAALPNHLRLGFLSCALPELANVLKIQGDFSYDTLDQYRVCCSESLSLAGEKVPEVLVTCALPVLIKGGGDKLTSESLSLGIQRLQTVSEERKECGYRLLANEIPSTAEIVGPEPLYKWLTATTVDNLYGLEHFWNGLRNGNVLYTQLIMQGDRQSELLRATIDDIGEIRLGQYLGSKI